MGARFCKQQQRFQQGGGILAAGERHGHAVAVANHLETVDRFPHLAQQCFFQLHRYFDYSQCRWEAFATQFALWPTVPLLR